MSRKDPSVELYGFLEAGFPIIIVLKTARARHALTVIGHTFDKNSWSAVALPNYFDRPLTGGESYYSNTNWISNFIVQDDNFGPYFFISTEVVAEYLEIIYVPLPFLWDIRFGPHAAERAAFKALERTVPHLIDEKNGDPYNYLWHKILRNHFASDERLVLRTVIYTGQKVIESYANHAFSEVVSARFSDLTETPVWRVEVSWPNLYCFHECQVGEVILDAETGDPLLTRIPGTLVFFKRGEMEGGVFRTDCEEPPYVHDRPASVLLSC